MRWLNNSRLFELAKQGQRLTHIAAVIPLAALFVILSQLGVIPLIVALGMVYGFTDSGVSVPQDLPPLTSGLIMGGQLILAFVLIYAILWAWLKFFEKRRFVTLGYTPTNALKQYVQGFILGGLMFAGAIGILAAMGTVAIEQGDPTQQGVAALGGVAFMLIGWIVQGGGEEVLLRGWVLPVISARYRPWLGLLISSLLFSLLHGINPGISPLALFNIALFGVFAGLYALREGTLWGISAVHSVWNWVQGNFFGLEVSGTNPAGGTLMNLTISGSDWLTGGAFGPEGGAAVTIVLLIGIGVILFWKTREGGSA
jgi:hypothetical protein